MSETGYDDARAEIAALLLSRRYDEAIAAAEILSPRYSERDGLLRMTLARAGRLEAAAEAGRRCLAQSLATPEDYYRQAQILLRCGQTRESLGAALTAVSAEPEMWRYQVPAVEAVLNEPALEPDFLTALQPIASAAPYRPPAPPAAPVALRVPCHLPHYATIEGRHPVFADLVAMIRNVSIYWPDDYGHGLVSAMLAAMPAARAMLDRLLALGDPAIDRASAARYVAARFPDLLAPRFGRMDFLQHAPITAGDRPFAFSFDNPSVLCQPFLPAEDMSLPEDAPGIFAILRHEIENPNCRGVVSIFGGSDRLLGQIFDSEIVRRKTIAVNPPWSSEDTAPRPTAPIRGEAETLTWFFPSSASPVTENFYLRGGVDVLNAFATLAKEDSRLRLVLRGTLPSNLSPRLRSLVMDDPRITWIANRLDWADYEALLRSVDLLLLPSILTFRNGLVQAIRWGLVPVLSDCWNSDELVENGINGVIVPGRRYGVLPHDNRPGFRAEWIPVLQATDTPPDTRFHAEFVGTLRRLGRDRTDIQRMSTHNLTIPCRGETVAADYDNLNNLILSAI